MDVSHGFIYFLPFKTTVDVTKPLGGNGSADIDSKFIFGVVFQIDIMTLFFFVINELWIQIFKEGTAGQSMIAFFKVCIVKPFLSGCKIFLT